MATKKKDHKQVNGSFLTLQSAIVVGAITFDYLVSKGNKDSVMFVPWLAVAGRSGVDGNVSEVPDSLSTWRRNGFAHFLFILAIKFTSLQSPSGTKRKRDKGSKTPISIYLQCSPLETGAVIFYKQAGFQDVTPSPNMDNGYSKVSSNCKDLLHSHADSVGGNVLFHTPPDGGEGFFMLMLLKTDHFRVPYHEFVDDQQQADVLKKWNECDLTNDEDHSDHLWLPDVAEKFPYAAMPYKPKYLHPGMPFNVPLVFNKSQVDSLLLQSKWLQRLVPDLGNNPKPPGAFNLWGEMTALVRSNHHETSWLSSSCLELFFNIMMSDGRYDDDVIVLSPYLSTDIQELYRLEKQMVEEYIQSKVNEETGTLLRSQKESIAKRWLDNMRGLFDRRVIVFVHNLGSSHWTATWVVNPGHIQFLSDDREMMLVDVNSKTNDSKPRTMFLYYDSMGDRRLFNRMPGCLGVQHFLNFAYTYLLGCDRGNHKMKHTNSTPFGVPDFNAENFIGCPAFPQAVIEKKSAFWVPLQKDVHSCGPAVVVTTMLFLKQRETDDDTYSWKYDSIFNTHYMPVVPANILHDMSPNQPLCILPGNFFKDTFHLSPNFLSDRRADFFEAVDKLAEIMHTEIPRLCSPSHEVPVYLKIARQKGNLA